MKIVPDYDDGLQEGQTVKITIPAADGDMTITADVMHRTTRDDEADGRMFRFKKIEVRGEDRTEEYLEKSFGGERVRGMPDDKLRDTDIKVIDK